MMNTSYGKDWNCPNLSSEWDKLIREAAQCDAYCSDILISYDSVVRKLNEGAEKVTEYFGFRDYGVDHDTFIKCRLPEYKYRKIYKLTIYCDEIQNYEGYRNWIAELSDITDMKAEDILQMIEEDE